MQPQAPAPNDFNVYTNQDGSSFAFTFGAPPSMNMAPPNQQAAQHQYPTVNTTVNPMNSFNFNPSVNTTNTGFYTPPQQQPTQYSYQQEAHDQKKRNFESPTNSMEFCYPEQFHKKSKVNVNP
jgi:hypothetical protein